MDYIRARKKTEKNLRRQAILDASKNLFARQEVEKTSIDQIAKACQLSRSLIYTYFLDKSHIFLVIVSLALKELITQFETAVSLEKTGLDKITSIGWAYVHFAKNNPEYYTATVRFHLSYGLSRKAQGNQNSALSESFRSDFQRVKELAAQLNQLMASQISLGVEDGSIRKDVGDPLQTALALWAMTSGLIQTSSAMEKMLPEPSNSSQSNIITQGLTLAKQGLSTQKGLI